MCLDGNFGGDTVKILAKPRFDCMLLCVQQVQPPGWPHLVTLMYPLADPKRPRAQGSTQQGKHVSGAEEEDVRHIR